MEKCKNCGNDLIKGDVFCRNCGFKNEISKDETQELSSENSVAKTEVEVTDSESEMKEKETQNKNTSATPEKSSSHVAKSSSNAEKYMSKDELWTYLKKDSKRQQFHSEEVCQVTEEEFIEKVKDNLKKNNVPADIQKRIIKWNKSDIKHEVYTITPLLEDSGTINPYSNLIMFNHVGKYSYVDEKSFITPPNLPAVPKKKLPYTPYSLKDGIIKIILGIVCIFAPASYFIKVGKASHGFWGVGKFDPTDVINENFGVIFLFALAGIFLIGVEISAYIKSLSVLNHNEMCDKMEKEWNDAWSNWENSVFINSFQEDTNGKLSRIYDSVHSVVEQTSRELFKEEAKTEAEASSMNELEELIARRKEDYR